MHNYEYWSIVNDLTVGMVLEKALVQKDCCKKF